MWHYVENRHFRLLFPIPPPWRGVFCGIMWRIGILGYSFQSTNLEGGVLWHYMENRHFGLLFPIPPPGEGCSVALCGE